MFYSQPLAHRFGNAFNDELESGRWTESDIAVAWVRRSGTKHLESSFRRFLVAGGIARLPVGIDIENTSEEGLSDLLAWESHGRIETSIHHNETDVTFHPKVYLLKNADEARLIVGSNNITEAGLFRNTEAGLQVDAAASDPLIADVDAALTAWRDTTNPLARRLDAALLTDLVRLGYVFPEKELRERRRASNAKSARRRLPRQRLFGSKAVSRPPVRGARRLPANVPGTVMLMRVRRASDTERRTQVQIPIRVVNTQFFRGIREIVSAHDGRAHPLVRATARGALNTIKVEIPEIEPLSDPVLRLERTANAILYQAFDSTSTLGAPIRQALQRGLLFQPPQTSQTIRDVNRATLWRFV
jgi:hemin uptake protein HemP